MTALEIGAYPGEEALLEAARRGQPGLSVYPFWETAVVLGRGSVADVELRAARCLEAGVPIYRRRGGGCAVVLDPGNVIIGLALQVPGIGHNQRYFNEITDWLTAGLGDMGLDGIYQDGVSDLVWADRKVGGACIYRDGRVLLYAASLLVRPDVALMTRYLKHPPREPAYRAGREHAAFVAALGARAPGLSVEGFAAQLNDALAHRPLPLAAL
ncbi:hypothetical protein KKF91_14970 [Myxococcota bacterium]|nr:hypothetical protein [Myxococcota bacterium]